MIDVQKDGKDEKFFIRGGFAEIGPAKITVLAEEAIPMGEMDVAVLDQRIRDAEEDVIAAKTDSDKARASETLDDLKLVRAFFDSRQNLTFRQYSSGSRKRVQRCFRSEPRQNKNDSGFAIRRNAKSLACSGSHPATAFDIIAFNGSGT